MRHHENSMQRRDFLKSSLATTALGTFAGTLATGCRQVPSIMTVGGPIAPEQMGVTLPHEHVLVDFIGAREVSPDRYNRNEVFRTVMPYVEQFRELGGQTLIECTPAYLGRDPLLLQQLSEAAGIHILTNTGYYGAREGQFLPQHALSESADQLAARWTREWEEGIDGTGIRPGFMKIGVNSGALSEMDRKLVEAAARTHLKTGLTIAVHTGPAVPAFEQLEVLEREGVDPSAWIWVHAHAEADSVRHVEAARRGAWVEFDGLDPDQSARFVAFALAMKERGVLHRTLISHDAGWYHVGEPDGGSFRPYDTLFTTVVPALTNAGFTRGEIRQVLMTNPADAFAVRVRAR
jgi:phosphotriesterase-related protein